MAELSFDNYLMVAAIDFGTTFSGYAFLLRDEFAKDPLKIRTNQAWNAGGRQLLSLKTPTCLLLNSEKKLVAFGYEAENKYSDLVMDEKHRDYYYFHRFKMSLYKTKNLKKDMIIEDITGKSVLAIEVFALSIQALKDHLLSMMTTQGIGIIDDEIRWVLTVPAIWTDAAKQFMRRSAERAGIDGSKLRIALEPEVASIYCQHLPIDKLTGASTHGAVADAGVKYLIVDLGGGTADLTVHEKLNDGRLKEICRASGGDCGGTSVDTAFLDYLKKITEKRIIDALQQEYPEEFIDLLREFEMKKRTLDPSATGLINMTIPFTTIDSLCKKYAKEDLASMISSASSVEIRRDKIRIDVEVFKSFFVKPSSAIIEIVREILSRNAAKSITAMILVGGFASCRIIQNDIKREFPSIQIIIPEDCELSVLKGAVIFGHRPDLITARVAKYTYGLGYRGRFQPRKHDRARLRIVDGVEKCYDLFEILIKRDDVIPISKLVTTKYVGREESNNFHVTIYKSECENPVYTNEAGCSRLGQLSMKETDLGENSKSSYNVETLFGETEIHVTCKSLGTGKICKGTFDMI